jgi:hypothetical protein
MKIYRHLDALGSKLANIMVEFLMSAFSSPPEQTKKRTAVRDEPLCALNLFFDNIKRQSDAFALLCLYQLKHEHDSLQNGIVSPFITIFVN